MDLRQMEYFVALAEEQQFTRAAELTRVSQSGLSASIRTLEDELQATLFTRSTRKVELTDAGRALLPHARSLLSQAVAGKDAVVATRAEVLGELRVGGDQCLGAIDVPELLARFHHRYPKVRVVFAQAGSYALLESMRMGELDVVFVAGSASSPRASIAPNHAVTHRDIASESLVLVAAPEHPLAKSSRVELADLAAEVFIDFEQSWAMRVINDEAFERTGLHRNVAFTVSDVHTLLDLVHRELGVGLVPRSIASKPQAAGLAIIPVSGDDVPTWNLRMLMAAHDGTMSTASRFVEMLPGG
jgi:DNA-binding transcriptional LysR family regulator